jgi:hypothetical protein
VTNLGQLDTTFVTFRISAEGQVLGLPLNRLVKWESASLYLAVSSEPEVPESLSPSLGDFEIVFGQQMIESFYVAFDLETKRFGFANKLVSDDINLSMFHLLPFE